MKKTFLLITALFSSLALNAQNNPTESMTRIKEKNVGYTSIYSQFTQIRHMPILDGDISSPGTFYYVKPDQVMMLFDNPAGDLMLMDRDRFTMVADGQTRRTTSRSSETMREMKTILTAALEGDITRLDASEIKEAHTPGMYRFEITMNSSSTPQVVFCYDRNDLSILSIRMAEPDGSYQEYLFSAKHLNRPIDKKVFQTGR